MTITPTAIRIVRAVATPGEFQLAEWETTVKPAAAHKARVLVKRTVAAVECGTAYADLAEVKAGIVAGARGEVQSLPWGTWLAAPYLIGHKNREYLRVNLAAQGIVSVTYTVDGREVTREEFSAYLTPGQRAEKPRPLTVTIPVENIRRIGGVTLAA